MTEHKTIFAVSDIHGHFTELKTALDKAGFRRNDPDHLLVCCGDYFDRGSENLKVLKFLDCLENKILLRGNHEDMLLKILQTGRLQPHNYLNGTLETVTELFGKHCIDPVTDTIDFSGKTRMLDRLTDFINETADFYETDTHVFVHGWLPTVKKEGTVVIDENWRNASKDKWEQARFTKWTDMFYACNRVTDKTLVCGHVPTFFANRLDKTRHPDNADIFSADGLTVIDAGVFTSGKVNMLVIKEN